ncbi:MAG TPA: AraC family transcriptional regulator [Flavobacteriaceae bacterium]|nr:AraC family transcriptional regulator [Flavobacteriaceae bacterium]
MKKHLEIKALSPKIDLRSSREYYRVFWFSEGLEAVRISGKTITGYPNLIVFSIPQQDIQLDCKKHVCGWVLEFSKYYFDLLGFEPLIIKDAKVYYATGQVPKIVLSPKIGQRIQALFEMIDEMAGSEIPNKESGMFSLLRTILVYCDSTCNIDPNKEENSRDLQVVLQYKNLVAAHYTEWHKVSDYARHMHLTPKHLNFLVKKVMGVTAKQLIKDQLLIHARRDLKFTDKSIKEIALYLGFQEPFHFSSFFKKSTGKAPTDFRVV